MALFGVKKDRLRRFNGSFQDLFNVIIISYLGPTPVTSRSDPSDPSDVSPLTHHVRQGSMSGTERK